MCVEYILRPERRVGAVLEFDEYGSGFETFGVEPLAERDADRASSERSTRSGSSELR